MIIHSNTKLVNLWEVSPPFLFFSLYCLLLLSAQFSVPPFRYATRRHGELDLLHFDFESTLILRNEMEWCVRRGWHDLDVAPHSH